MPKVKVAKEKLWKAIRKKCLECGGSTKEVRICESTDCPLHQYRFGRIKSGEVISESKILIDFA